jgi:endonuclease-8
VPEGDTIARTARTLHAALSGRTVTGFASMLAPVEAAAERHRIVGRTVEAVEARGKHLILRFSGGPALHTHMRMTGRWHLYRSSRPGLPRGRLSLTAGEVTAVCLAAPVIELLSEAELARHPALTRLGPDLLGADFDARRARERLRAQPASEIGVALLDQSLLAGIGNIHKCEALFLCGVDPFVRVASLDDAQLDRLVATARRNLQRGVLATGRETRWVHHCAGRPCRRCGAVIRYARQGPDARSTYWCPGCQK